MPQERAAHALVITEAGPLRDLDHAPHLATFEQESRRLDPERLHALLVLVIGAMVLGLPDTFLAAPMTLTIYVVLAAAIAGRR